MSAQAWDLFHRFASGLMRALVRKHGLSRDEVDDVLQEAWLVIYARLPGFDIRQLSGLRAWLRAIVLNKEGDQLRRRRHGADSIDGGFDKHHPVDPKADPALLLEKVGSRELVFAILAKLESRESMANLIPFRLRHLEEMDAADIAVILNISKVKVAERIHRMIAKFRTELARHHQVPGNEVH